MSLFRGLADDLPLMEWLNGHIFPAEARFINPETVFAGALLSCAEMLLSGTTAFVDGYFLEEHVARAVEVSGMRAVLGHGVIDFPAPGVPDPGRNVEAAMAFVERRLGRHSRITPSVFCHAPYTCSEHTLKKAKARAREAGVLFQIHTAETLGEREQCVAERGLSPVRYLESLGVLDDKTLAVHCVATDPEDIRALLRNGAAVAACAGSNMKLASGVAPVTEMLARGVRLGLGTDSPASNNNLDMFREMDLAARLQKTATGKPSACPARDVFLAATRRGAEAAGLGAVCGSIEPGKRADLAVMDAASPRLAPCFSPVSALVYAANGGDARHVVVDGRVLVRDRQITAFSVRDAMEEVRRFAWQIRAANGQGGKA
jgi:5-methylthioadenosine/S-adenosylhomocysteine deaminase